MRRVAISARIDPGLRPTLSALMTLILVTPSQAQETGAAVGASKRPNILLIMCDDMGWRDLSCFGNDQVATPHVDRLAAEGTKLRSTGGLGIFLRIAVSISNEPRSLMRRQAKS